MEALALRFAVATALSFLIGNYFYSIFPVKKLDRTPDVATSFFPPERLVLRSTLRLWRSVCSAAIAGGVFTFFFALTDDANTTANLNQHLLKLLGEVAPPAKEVLEAFGGTSDAKAILVFSAALTVVLVVFLPHVLIAIKAMRTQAHRILQFDSLAEEQISDAANQLIASSGDDAGAAIQNLTTRLRTLHLAPEYDKVQDDEKKLKYLILLAASRRAPDVGMTAALDIVLQRPLRPGAAHTAHDLVARVLAYAILCMLYVVLIPLCGRTDAPCPRTIFGFLSFKCDWFDTSPAGIQSLAITLAELSFIVVLPFIIGLNQLAARRRGIGDLERVSSSLSHVCGNILIMSVAFGGLAAGMEVVRFYLATGLSAAAPTVSVAASACPDLKPVDAAHSLLRNIILFVLTSFLPVILLAVWAWVRSLQRGRAMALAACALVAALGGYGLMALFDQLTLIQDQVELRLAFHNAVLLFYLVIVSGVVVLLFNSRASTGALGPGSLSPA